MTLNAGRKFTPVERRTLELMYTGGETYAMIAAALGRSVKSVESMRRAMGLPPRANPANARNSPGPKRCDFERSVGKTLQEHNAATRAKAAVTYHLIDLRRAYSSDPDEEHWEIVECYRRLNELNIPPGAERTLIIPSTMTLSGCSSSAGWMA